MTKCSTTDLTYNPKGYDYIQQNFEFRHVAGSIAVFANVVNSTDLFVRGVNVAADTASAITVRFLLNKAYSENVSMRIGFIYYK